MTLRLSMRENPKTLRACLRILEHRVVRPRVWNAFLVKQVQRQPEQKFLQLFGHSGTMEEFVQQFHDAVRYRFFFHPRNQKDFFLQLITKTQPYEQILSEAQDVIENRFETLGSGKVHLGEKISWRQDFKSGKIWPMAKLTAEEILDLGHPSDIKVPWELSRFHQVWWLGKAYWVTRNEQYAQKFGALIEDWIEQNPLGEGPNWTAAMEAAIRACNWIAGYYFFCESKSLSPQFWLRFLKSLHAHGRFIENNLEYSWRNGNHFLSDIVGLTFLGNFFHQTSFGKMWLRRGVAGLQEAMETQVYPDGVDYEKSTSYHRLVLELFYSATILCMKNNIRFAGRYMQQLERMVEFVQHYTRPDGSAPLIGDADDGRLFKFSMSEDLNDHRHALSVGAILFDRRDFQVAAGEFSQDALWFFGGEGFEKHQRLQGESLPFSSRAFPDGGFYVLRSSDAHIFVDAGDLGMMGRGGHGHNDTLSFELWAHGAPLIVDSGTYAYTSDAEARAEFRSTRAHNTVVVDGREIAEFADLWSVKEDATNPKVLEWNTDDQRDVLVAEHHGYQRIASGVTHRRGFKLSKQALELVVTDEIIGTGKHEIQSFLHFAPGVKLELSTPNIAIAHAQTDVYRIAASDGVFSTIGTQFSRSYGLREPNVALELSLTIRAPQTITIQIQHEKRVAS
jgi:uncharacterized heparinase superfamily protein